MKSIEPLPVTDANKEAVRYVGTRPEEGLAQLAILQALGCTPNNTVLEIGCGALIAGFPIMQYLAPGSYYGVDPNGWLSAASCRVERVKQEGFKRPQLSTRDDFYFYHPDVRFGPKFDYILSHSVLSHAGDAQVDSFFRAILAQLAPGGRCACSLRLAEGNAYGSPGSTKHGRDFHEWQYPGVSWFRRDDVITRANAIGLTARVEGSFTKMIVTAHPAAVHDWIVLENWIVLERK